MAKNKMKEVAQLLGLELEAEFRLEDVPYRYKLTECGLFVKYDDEESWHVSTRLESLLTGKYQIVKLPKPILDDVEKEYLSSVIKPFRDKVISIAKCDIPGSNINCHYIQIKVNQGYHYEYISLPYFKSGKMYKGMKVNREYTLEELGL